MNHTRVVHCKKSNYDIYIGRPSPWGNPYGTKEDSKASIIVKDRQTSLLNYAKYIGLNKELQDNLYKLEGKILACWCSPDLPCHGNILVELLEDVKDKYKEIIIEDSEEIVDNLNNEIIKLRREGVFYVPLKVEGNIEFQDMITESVYFLNNRYKDINIVLFKYIDNMNSRIIRRVIMIGNLFSTSDISYSIEEVIKEYCPVMNNVFLNDERKYEVHPYGDIEKGVRLYKITDEFKNKEYDMYLDLLDELGIGEYDYTFLYMVEEGPPVYVLYKDIVESSTNNKFGIYIRP